MALSQRLKAPLSWSELASLVDPLSKLSKRSAADLVSLSQACTCEPGACRTAPKWDRMPH